MQRPRHFAGNSIGCSGLKKNDPCLIRNNSSTTRLDISSHVVSEPSATSAAGERANAGCPEPVPESGNGVVDGWRAVMARDEIEVGGCSRPGVRVQAAFG
jgi:hypothetical protein